MMTHNNRGMMEDVLGIILIAILVFIIVWFFVFIQNKSIEEKIEECVQFKLGIIRATEYAQLYLRTPVSPGSGSTFYDLIIESIARDDFTELESRTDAFLTETHQFEAVHIFLEFDEKDEKSVASYGSLLQPGVIWMQLPVQKSEKKYSKVTLTVYYTDTGKIYSPAYIGEECVVEI